MTRALSDLDWPRRTERLAIRPLAWGDVETVFGYRSDPEVARWVTSLPTALEQFAGQMLSAASTLVIERDGVLVGDLMLKVQDAWSQAEVTDRARGTQAEIGWTVAPAHQGQGYATEAVRELIGIAFDLGVRRIEAGCFAENEASWHLMERVGMRREGVFLGESLHRDGTWRDGMTYALRVDEWDPGAGGRRAP